MTAKVHKTYFIRTFGCQMNEHDSGRMATLLEGLGYAKSAALEEADLVLFNTCTIREKAYHKAESEIGRMSAIKAKRGSSPERSRRVLVGVCGCVAQQEGISLKSRFGHVDFVFGPDQLASLPQLISRAEEGEFTAALDFILDPASSSFPHRVAEGTVHGGSAFVSIMKGCNGCCSYCIVPSVRGPEVHRPADEVVDEIVRLADRGAREITLLGQNVNAYPEFAALVRRIAGASTVERIRFTSPHPRDVDEDLIAAYAEEPKLCPHIHLPVQAGSNAVLKRMRRGYTREHYCAIVEALRNARPGIAITTDMIVGFCGESAEDFEDTIDLMERVRFDSMFAFRYSERPGTHAADALDDDVPFDVKRARLEKVLSLQRGIQRSSNELKVGSVLQVLVVKEDAREPGRLTGRAGDNRLVHFTGHASLIGDIVPVCITSASMHSLQGKLEEELDVR